MELVIKSRKYNKEITFSKPGKTYVFVDLNGKEGSLGRQICDGGSFTGSTISSCDTSFENDCRKWWKSYLRQERA